MNDTQKKDLTKSENTLKSVMSKKVSTLIGGLLVGGVTLLFLLTLLIIWLAR